ncbi:MAG: hypothetical protein AAFR46_05850 [Pseudomonadota bacterium]
MTLGPRLALLFLALCLPGAPASAQNIEDYSTPEGLHELHLCRAAVFYHLNADTRGDSTIPDSTVRILREQIEFVMQEGVLNKTPGSMQEGGQIIRFVEQFLIGFSEVLRDERALLLNPAERDKILHRCQPFVWVTVKTYIDYLIAWRVQGTNAPPLPDPQELLEAQDREIRELLD